MTGRFEPRSPAADIRALYIDCTHVHQTRNTSGIGRVVRNLAVLGSELSEELGVPVRPMLLTSRGFAVIPADWLTPRRPGVFVRLLRHCTRSVVAVFRSADALVVYSPMLTRLLWSGIAESARSTARSAFLFANRLVPSRVKSSMRSWTRSFALHLTHPDVGSTVTRWLFGIIRIAFALVAWVLHLFARALNRAISFATALARRARRSIRGCFPWLREQRQVMRRALLALRLRGRLVELGAGDVLLLADSNWDSSNLWPHVTNARDRGAIIASVVYDLIPLRHPDFVDENLTRVFTSHLRQVTANNDFIVAISRDTCLDFLDFARSTVNPGWSAARARTFRLGSDKWTGDPTECSEACGEVVRRVGDRAAYLIVGTFEVRKNHRTVLDAFDQLWSEGSDICLLILGRPGFRTGDQIARVRSHREWGNRLFWASNASDGDLESWYRASRGVIMASYAEGFGLPVAEALARGKSAITSDIPAHREIADGFCDFFDPSRPDELATLLRRDLAGDRSAGLKPVSDFQWPDWHESVRECLGQCIAAASLGPRGRPTAAIHLGSS